jgi:hypothetical protein
MTNFHVECRAGPGPLSIHMDAPPESSHEYPHKSTLQDCVQRVSLANMFQRLHDATDGQNCIISLKYLIDAIVPHSVLEILQKYSWVHRNISSRNIIFYNGGGRLSDFECAQKTTRLTDNEVITVQCQVYSFTYI